VDLSAESPGTAIASIEWSADRAVVRDLVLGADDSRVVAVADGADKVGIDCPLGWPVPFIEFVSSHRDGRVEIPQGVAGRDWRRKLAFRMTDDAVRQLTGLIPLSVAADRIGHTAMRCAGLLAQLVLEGERVDRRGLGVVVEVYPAASLKQWKLPYRGYKGTRNAAMLAGLVDALVSAAPWLALGEFESLCRRSDDAFDAVVAAMTARAALLDLVMTPSAEQSEVAAIEGWIAVPTAGSLPCLEPSSLPTARELRRPPFDPTG
jgi:predicted nuclease with RNAse H fold